MLACSKGDWFGKRHNIDRHILDNFNAVSIDPFEERKRERERQVKFSQKLEIPLKWEIIFILQTDKDAKSPCKSFCYFYSREFEFLCFLRLTSVLDLMYLHFI